MLPIAAFVAVEVGVCLQGVDPLHVPPVQVYNAPQPEPGKVAVFCLKLYAEHVLPSVLQPTDQLIPVLGHHLPHDSHCKSHKQQKIRLV